MGEGNIGKNEDHESWFVKSISGEKTVRTTHPSISSTYLVGNVKYYRRHQKTFAIELHLATLASVKCITFQLLS